MGNHPSQAAPPAPSPKPPLTPKEANEVKELVKETSETNETKETKETNNKDKPRETNEEIIQKIDALLSEKDEKTLVMLSVHCGTMLASANLLKQVLLQNGFEVFLCDQMQSGDNYRHEISLNAAQCHAFIPFMNAPWCKSKECEYEFNIALRMNFVKQGVPRIIPLILEDFPFYADYPTINGFLCSFNGLRVSPDELNDATWQKLLRALQKSAPLSPPVPHPARPTSTPTLTPQPEVVLTPKPTVPPLSLSVVAGSHSSGSCDAEGKDARFNTPHDLVQLHDGSFLVLDSLNHQIRKITSTGSVTTLAGCGKEGFQDGPSSKAMFHHPYGIAAWHTHNVYYISDPGNRRIRKFSYGSTEGVVIDENKIHISGTGLPAHVWSNILQISDQKTIVRISQVCTALYRLAKKYTGNVSTFAGNGAEECKDGKGESASFKCPLGIAVRQEDGTVFVADCHANALRVITSEGEVSTFSGTWQRKGCSSFKTPGCLKFDDSESALYIVDDWANIYKISKDGYVATFAFGLNAFIRSLAWDAHDQCVLITDERSGCVGKVKSKEGQYTTIAKIREVEKWGNPHSVVIDRHSRTAYFSVEHAVLSLSL